MSEQHPSVKAVSGTGIVVRGNDIDTDQIIPARYMKVVTFDGLGEFAFRDVRYDEAGNELDHPFNEPELQDHNILVVNSNFGCGSSREHAPQALKRWGIDAIIGESYAEIFAGNCTAMGVPAVVVTPDQVSEIMEAITERPDTQISIDLPTSKLVVGDREYSFSLPPAYRSSLIAGTWDSTSVLLQNIEDIHQTADSLPYVNSFAARSA